MILKKIWSYLTFQQQPDFEENVSNNNEISDKNAEPGFIKLPERKFTAMMHGINRLSILMFIIGIIVVVIKILIK